MQVLSIQNSIQNEKIESVLRDEIETLKALVSSRN